MSSAKIRDLPRVKFLNKKEGRALFDRVAHRALGISGEEFIRRLDQGQYPDEDESPEIARLCMLTPFWR
jgi:hypothetical protein